MIGRYHTRRNVPVRPSPFSSPSIRRAVRGICHGHRSESAITLVQLRVVMAGLDPDLYPQVGLGTVVRCKSTAAVAEAAEAAEAGWISTLRPWRRPRRGLLRLRNFLNALKNRPNAEGARRARLEARTASMKAFIAPVLRSAIVGG